MLAIDKHTSFLLTFTNYGRKSFVTFGPELLGCQAIDEEP
jgi:hypothetical protein